MYRLGTDFKCRSEFGAVLMAVLMALLIGGCATSGSKKSVSDETASNETAGSREASAPTTPPEQAIRPASVEVEANLGFTVTEVVSITGDSRADYHEALSLLAHEDYKGGIALLVEVTDRTPDATAPFVDLGIAYSRSGAFEKAESSLNHALASTPDHPVAHNELGIVYRKLGRFELARRSYERALGIYPGFHYARRNLAVLCDLYLADLTCALEHYEIYSQAVTDDREVNIWISDIRNRISPTE